MDDETLEEVKLEEVLLEKSEINIFLVDDEVHLAENIQTLLKNAGYSVDMVTCGEDAVARLKQTSYHLVITDLVMPDLDGLSVMEFVQNRYPDTVIIVITGYASTESAINAMRKGAYDYIIKPFDIDYLMFTVERAIEKIKLEMQVKANYQKILEYAKRLEKANLKLQELSNTDGLTKLFNQTYFHKCLQKEGAMALRYYSPLSCLMIDIDNFKQVNDNFGHPFGDKVLSELADIIRESIRETDVACRYGGDEFFILLPQTDIVGTETLAERLRKKVFTRVFRDADHSARLTVSIGVSTFSPAMAEDKAKLLTITDNAMYNAKVSGKNRVSIYVDPADPEKNIDLSKNRKSDGVDDGGDVDRQEEK